MIVPGQTLTNPVTGERLVFHVTARETGGEYVRFEAVVSPGGTLASPHLHPYQTERFEILEGSLSMTVGGRRLEAAPGDVVVIRPGTPHDFVNRGDRDTRMLVEVRPALALESLLETMYSLAADGKTNRFGLPNPFRLAVIARAHFDTVRLPVVPAWAQRAALAVGAPLGRLLGYGPVYRPEPARASAARPVPAPA